MLIGNVVERFAEHGRGSNKNPYLRRGMIISIDPIVYILVQNGLKPKILLSASR